MSNKQWKVANRENVGIWKIVYCKDMCHWSNQSSLNYRTAWFFSNRVARDTIIHRLDSLPPCYLLRITRIWYFWLISVFIFKAIDIHFLSILCLNATECVTGKMRMRREGRVEEGERHGKTWPAFGLGLWPERTELENKWKLKSVLQFDIIINSFEK